MFYNQMYSFTYESGKKRLFYSEIAFKIRDTGITTINIISYIYVRNEKKLVCHIILHFAYIQSFRTQRKEHTEYEDGIRCIGTKFQWDGLLQPEFAGG